MSGFLEFKAMKPAALKLKKTRYEAAVAFKAVLDEQDLNANVVEYKKTVVKYAKSDFWNKVGKLMLDSGMAFAEIAKDIHENAGKSGSTGDGKKPRFKYTYEGYEGYVKKFAKNTQQVAQMLKDMAAPNFEVIVGEGDTMKHVTMLDGVFTTSGYGSKDLKMHVDNALDDVGSTIRLPKAHGVCPKTKKETDI